MFTRQPDLISSGDDDVAKSGASPAETLQVLSLANSRTSGQGANRPNHDSDMRWLRLRKNMLVLTMSK